MDGMYELKQSETGEMIKVFNSQFEPPEDTDKLHVIRFSECSPELMMVRSIEDAPMLQAASINIDDFNGLVVMINQKIMPLRSKLVFQFKLLFGYIVVGILLLGSTAVLLGIFVSYWISLLLILLYFAGLIVI